MKAPHRNYISYKEKYFEMYALALGNIISCLHLKGSDSQFKSNLYSFKLCTHRDISVVTAGFLAYDVQGTHSPITSSAVLTATA